MPKSKEEQIFTMESRSLWAEEVLSSVRDFAKEMNGFRKQMEKSRRAYIMHPNRIHEDGSRVNDFEDNSESLTDYIRSAAKLTNHLQTWLEKMVEREGLNPNILDNEQ